MPIEKVKVNLIWKKLEGFRIRGFLGSGPGKNQPDPQPD